MGILIDTVRIANFRAIKNTEVHLSKLTLLVGANNAGKTTFLKALQLALGIDRRVISKEDFHDDGKVSPDDLEILIDIRIISVNEDGSRISDFEQIWLEKDFSGNFKVDENSEQFVVYRTKCRFDPLRQVYVIETKELKQWLTFDIWQDSKNEGKIISKPESIPLIFMDAQRDIQLDLKDRFSFLGRLTNKPKFDDSKIEQIEKELNQLNEQIVNGSEPLKHLQKKLKDLSKTVNSQGGGVEISPLNRKLRDIGRNLNINFQDVNSQSFPLENHGMGTRSWASLLTLNAYISWQEENIVPYFPVLALEEPEAHLHPNAQRQLFHQLKNINGQKIISTHSPFVAAQCDLTDLRHFCKDGNNLKVGQILLKSNFEEERLKELNINVKKEDTPQNKKMYGLEIDEIKKSLKGKLDTDEVRKVRRVVMNTRGELLFAKAIILFEGETEEQALPILAKEKFGCHPFELGLNFIGVGGKLNYEPFLAIAKFMNIPSYILSDGDDNGNTEKSVKKQMKNIFNEVDETKIFVFENADFEGYLVNHNFHVELNLAINEVEKRVDYLKSCYIPDLHGKELTQGIFRDYQSSDGEIRALLDCLRNGKTKYAPVIAEQIIKKKNESGECIIPPKIEELFIQISNDLNIS